MSDLCTDLLELSHYDSEPCRGIELVLMPSDKDIGGFAVRRSLPVARRKTVGPWIFFDEMGPAGFVSGDGIDVRPHPHIGLATVTYLLQGGLLHRDSLGNHQEIKPGDINLMVAGKGIVHSERETEEVRNSQHQIHGLQLWFALPEEFEDTEPEFHHYSADQIPKTTLGAAEIRVLIGSAYGVRSPVKTFSETVYIEANLPAGATMTLPQTQEKAVYVLEGELIFNCVRLPKNSFTIFTDEADFQLEASVDSKLAIVGGAPIGHRYIEWNFVSSSREAIKQAKQDWKDNRFPKVPGDESEFIPFPEYKA